MKKDNSINILEYNKDIKPSNQVYMIQYDIMVLYDVISGVTNNVNK